MFPISQGTDGPDRGASGYLCGRERENACKGILSYAG